VYEHADRETARRLVPAEISECLQEIHLLVADFYCLSANCHFTAWDTNQPIDADARDIVDLILCGPLGWIIDQVDARSRRDPAAKLPYVKRREAYYARLHTKHGAAGSYAEAFNADAFAEV
jgi:hypothetical protein